MLNSPHLLLAFATFFWAANIVIGCVLAAAGDTHWLARAFCVASAVFLALLWLSNRIFPSLLVEWTPRYGFVCATALVWALRFHAGEWKKIRLLRQ